MSEDMKIDFIIVRQVRQNSAAAEEHDTVSPRRGKERIYR